MRLMRRFLSALVAPLVCAVATSAAAEKLPLSSISAYFNGFATAEIDFTQYNSDGSRAGGTLYMHRPGRARFEYDNTESVVIAGGGQVAIFDASSNSPPHQYPLSRTPLNLILERRVDLNNKRMVVGHQEVASGETVVVARDPKNPNAGQIDLYFAADPVRLTKWVITDEYGGQTTTVMNSVKTGERLSSRLFNIPLERQRRGF